MSQTAVVKVRRMAADVNVSCPGVATVTVMVVRGLVTIDAEGVEIPQPPRVTAFFCGDIDPTDATALCNLLANRLHAKDGAVASK